MAKRSPAAIFLWIIGTLAVVMGLGVTLLGIYQQELLAWATVPKHPISEETMSPAPNYTKDSAWAAHPSFKNTAQITPAGVMDVMVMPEVDVFYIHPTLYNKPDRWNMHYQDPAGSRFLESLILPNQLSVFHPQTTLYAPRYNAASLGAFYPDKEEMRPYLQGLDALMRPYKEIEAAFQNFLETRDPDKPFILAGHGQGAYHIAHLIENWVVFSDLQDKLIAAYMVGWPVRIDADNITAHSLPACAEEAAIGCIVSWSSFTQDAKDPSFQQIVAWHEKAFPAAQNSRFLCTNPLTWRIDDQASTQQNLGAVEMLAGQQSLPSPTPNLTGAKCVDGLLMVDKNLPSTWHQFDMGNGAMTLYDYNLFYMNIRQNIGMRIQAWKSKHSE